MDQVGAVQSQNIVYLLQEVQHVGEGKTVSRTYLLVRHRSQVAQLLKSLPLGLVELELDFGHELLDGDLGHLKRNFIFAGPLVLLIQKYYHNLRYF